MNGSPTEDSAEVARLRETYSAWEVRQSAADPYSFGNESYLFTIQQRQRAIIALLKRHSMWPVAGQRILEVGCGTGGVLLEFLTYGADPALLHGTDILAERVSDAHARLPNVPVNCADGRHLPYADHSFDMVASFTVFSSILDLGIVYTVAQEMVRVVKPNGLILWYDFWINPVNKQTRGMRPKQIRSLFPNCTYDFSRITLAPPLARRTVPIAWTGSLLLEKLGIFNTHYLAAIRPAMGHERNTRLLHTGHERERAANHE